MPGQDIVESYNQQFQVKLPSLQTIQTKQEFFNTHRRDFQPIRPVVDIVVRYKDRLPMAVASGGSRKNVDILLEAIGIRTVLQCYYHSR